MFEPWSLQNLKNFLSFRNGGKDQGPYLFSFKNRFSVSTITYKIHWIADLRKRAIGALENGYSFVNILVHSVQPL